MSAVLLHNARNYTAFFQVVIDVGHISKEEKVRHTNAIMKLLIATGLYPPDIGGPATYTVFLEKHLKEHGVDVTVVHFGQVRKYPKILRHVVYLWKLVRVAVHVDVFYALDTVSVGVPVCIASMLTRKPYLLRVPGDYAWEQGQQRFGVTETLDAYLVHTRHALPVRMLAWIQTRVALRAWHIVVPSEYLKRVVMHWGVRAEKITRVYSALKTIEVRDTHEALRTRLGHTGWVVLSAGRLVPWKGMRALIEVTKKLHDAGVPVALEILGDGVSRNALVEQIQNLGADGYIRLLGELPREQMAERIKAADVFVLNTSYEGLSHQLIEVMSLGVPVVTTPVGGNTELITDAETGILVPYNDTEKMHDALMRLYCDPALGTALATKAYTRTALFHEDVAIKEFVSLTHSLWKY